MRRIMFLLVALTLSCTSFSQTFTVDVDKKRVKPGEEFTIKATLVNTSESTFVVPHLFDDYHYLYFGIVDGDWVQPYRMTLANINIIPFSKKEVIVLEPGEKYVYKISSFQYKLIDNQVRIYADESHYFDMKDSHNIKSRALFHCGFRWKKAAKEKFGYTNPLEVDLYSNEIKIKFLKEGPTMTTLLAIGAGVLLLLLCLALLYIFVLKPRLR